MADFRIAKRKCRPGITVEEALDDDRNMIPALSVLQHTTQFENELWDRRSQIEEVVSRHLGIPTSGFELTSPDEWLTGSFNLCIFIHSIKGPNLPGRAILRIPLPFNAGETFSLGSCEEKLRCEAATYIWLSRHCPAIPIPRLLGIGFPGTHSFSAITNETLWNRLVWQLRHGWAWLWGRADTLAPFSIHHRHSLHDVGYLLIEYVEEGKMLSCSWKQHCQDPIRRANLYHGLAKIMLSLGKVPLPRIGSWILGHDATIRLTNRPFFDLTALWNQHKIPAIVPRERTYTSAKAFVHDVLRYQDNRMRHQPNSILSEKDGIYQLAALVGLRDLLSLFYGSSSGTFVLNLVDMHQSNIFVDENWNITRLIDFEFAPVCPIEMPWLSSMGVDQLEGSNRDEYKVLYDEFADIVEQEEEAGQMSNSYSQGLRESWASGQFFFNLALRSINAFPAIFEEHLQSRYFEKFDFDMDGLQWAERWDEGEDLMDFIARKNKDRERYEVQIREIFSAAKAAEGMKSTDDELSSIGGI
ncbi:hypothetical protein BT63DRAFT_249075 [Microthyrium microscopicum]|uniref:Aminoglycoside phosphotransferase domain-containing protein n=1 Tax=Microthyrium microscopicum TaxID=703497 RepID=A0A6A6U9V3_9PEZI|nr:hypothetical protein BT63DRAFT_249075 [Microthyrium microscopicum]